jgi:hypothetical protein
MMGFKAMLRRKRTKSPVTPVEASQPTANPAPAAEEEVQNDPPPYSPPPTATNSDGTGGPSGVLDPGLTLTASAMEQRWVEKDRLFARVVVQFIAERFDGNLRGWAGYKYTYISNVRLLVPHLFLAFPFSSFSICFVLFQGCCLWGRKRIHHGRRVYGII